MKLLSESLAHPNRLMTSWLICEEKFERTITVWRPGLHCGKAGGKQIYLTSENGMMLLGKNLWLRPS